MGQREIREFHLFAGIGGGIYGGLLLGHRCVAGVEIDPFCQQVLKQRQDDGWFEAFPIYADLRELSGTHFIGSFDVLCGGFPCQAFSSAARGRNIAAKDLWSDMLRFIRESQAPIVFAENVALKALNRAKADLESESYRVSLCKLSCGELGAAHRRDRYWLLAIRDEAVFERVSSRLAGLPRIKAGTWENSPYCNKGSNRKRLKALGNAQSPFAAAAAFRILSNRYSQLDTLSVSHEELANVFEKPEQSWVQQQFGNDFGFVHTPTTIANYAAPSMMKHAGCRLFVQVFGKPHAANAEYLMGFPQGASSSEPVDFRSFQNWHQQSSVPEE